MAGPRPKDARKDQPDRPESRERRRIIALSGVLGVCLLQSGIVGGFNTSVADIFLVLLLVSMALERPLVIPRIAALFLLAVSAVSIIAALFVIPALFGVTGSLQGPVGGIIKLCAAFAYFVLGANLAESTLTCVVLKSFAWAAAVTSALGIVTSIAPLPGLDFMLYAGGARFLGLASDPNLWGLLLVCALPFLFSRYQRGGLIRWLAVACIIAGVIMSGSKTATISLLCYLLFRATLEVYLRGLSRVAALVAALGLGLLVLAQFLPLGHLAAEWEANSTAVSRLMLLVTDPLGAWGENGSGRDGAFAGALQVIGTSPILGVGAGGYEPVVRLLGIGVLAHNTYLQLAAEWGLLLSCALFTMMLLVVVRAYRSGRGTGMGVVQAEVLIVLLVGSLGVSLNNVRLLWLLFGALFVAWQRCGPSTRQATPRSPDRPVPDHRVRRGSMKRPRPFGRHAAAMPD